MIKSVYLSEINRGINIIFVLVILIKENNNTIYWKI